MGVVNQLIARGAFLVGIEWHIFNAVEMFIDDGFDSCCGDDLKILYTGSNIVDKLFCSLVSLTQMSQITILGSLSSICYMEVSGNRDTPKIIHFNGIFHSKPSSGGGFPIVFMETRIWFYELFLLEIYTYTLIYIYTYTLIQYTYTLINIHIH